MIFNLTAKVLTNKTRQGSLVAEPEQSNSELTPENQVKGPLYFLISTLPGLHDQKRSGLFVGPAFSSQSELFEKLLNSSEWLEESRPSKKTTSLLDM